MKRVLAVFDGLYEDADFGKDKMEFLRARNRAIITLMADCGLRGFEIRHLETSGIDFDHDELVFAAKGRRRGREANRMDTAIFGPTTRKALLEYRVLCDAIRPSAKQFFVTCEGSVLLATFMWPLRVLS
jgi:site-specific recombinase XerC